MILKVKTFNDGWIYFEGDLVEYHYLTDQEMKDFVLTSGVKYQDNDSKVPFKEFLVNDKVVICTNALAYLLTDEGKTIEKIK